MRVTIVGGGPAGLYLAILLKRRDPGHRVLVLERNPAGATWGWGVVFSDQTLGYLAEPDPESFADLRPRLATWDNVDVVHRGERVSIHGNRFSGVARIALLRVLQERARALGVEVRYEAPVSAPAALDELPPCDLLVGADGIASVVRERYAEAFAPRLEPAANRYIWLGTPHLFHGLTLIFRPVVQHPGAPPQALALPASISALPAAAPAASAAPGPRPDLFIAHAYRYGPELSTFIVECDPATFERSGLGERDDDATRAYLGAVFAPDLDGAPLFSNQSRWIRFTTVRNARWWCHDPRPETGASPEPATTAGAGHAVASPTGRQTASRAGRHVVLLGDALHTAHFSIGSGTKLALEDAIALDRALAGAATPAELPAALDAFVAARRPRVEQLQAAAATSMAWFENAADDLALSPLAFAYRVMTRSARVDTESLRKRDPVFAAACERELGPGFAGG
jgi:anthraniloyl-CoA monooxygenase